MRIRRWVVQVLATSACITGWPCVVCAAPELRNKGWLYTDSGVTIGIAPNSDIRRVHHLWALEHRFSQSFSAAFEVTGAYYAGTRAGVRASTWGLGAVPVARWRFLRWPLFTAYFDFGFGGAVFREAFPPGGTHLNGFSLFGLGAAVALRSDVSVHVQARQMHHSNGGGFAANNPAFDGGTYSVGASFALY